MTPELEDVARASSDPVTQLLLRGKAETLREAEDSTSTPASPRSFAFFKAGSRTPSNTDGRRSFRWPARISRLTGLSAGGWCIDRGDDPALPGETQAASRHIEP